MELWPRFLASSFLVKEEVGWQSENCCAEVELKMKNREIFRLRSR